MFVCMKNVCMYDCVYVYTACVYCIKLIKNKKRLFFSVLIIFNYSDMFV